MRRCFFTFVIVLVANGFAAVSAKDRFETLKQDIPTLLEEGYIPGFALAVLEEGVPVWHSYFGKTNVESGETVNDKSVFQAASLTKPVFAYMCLRLVDRGLLNLDKPLVQYLPYERLAHEPRAKKITARLVLSHQTGLPNWGDEKLELNFDPGTSFNYSGEGYVFLQRVLEKLTGMDLPQLARQEVFVPLGMSRSMLTVGEEDLDQLAFGHNEWGGDPGRRTWTDANAASSLHTTASDYARFLQAAYRGTGLSEKSRREMFRHQVQVINRGNSPKGQKVIQHVFWALGWGISKNEGTTHAWHWGDNGRYKALTAINLENGNGFVYFANGNEGLSIAKDITAKLGVDKPWFVDWIDYRPYNAPGRKASIEGDRFAAEGKWSDAIASLKQAAGESGDAEGYSKRIEWLEALAKVAKAPKSIDPQKVSAFLGQYGPRKLFMDQGQFSYQREGNSAYRLIQLSEHLFALDGLYWFRLEVELNSEGEPIALLGHYLNGNSDRSPRDGL